MIYGARAQETKSMTKTFLDELRSFGFMFFIAGIGYVGGYLSKPTTKVAPPQPAAAAGTSEPATIPKTSSP